MRYSDVEEDAGFFDNNLMVWRGTLMTPELNITGVLFSVLPNPLKMITFADIKTKPDSLIYRGYRDSTLQR